MNALVIDIAKDEECPDQPPYVIIAAEYFGKLFYDNHIAAKLPTDIKVRCIGEKYAHIKTVGDINKQQELESK